jgi:AAA+ superfamily predicted ATPase
MDDAEFSRSQFARAFKTFLDDMAAEADAGQRTGNPVYDRIREHLGLDPRQLEVHAEEFDPFDHPNLQVAIDAFLDSPERQAQIVGISVQNRRYMELSLSEILTGEGWIQEGPIDYVNFHLAGGRLLPCVQFGVYLISDHGRRLVAVLSGPVPRANRVSVRIEVIAAESALSQELLSEIRDTMLRLNIYRGQVLSLSPAQRGMGSDMRIAFHELPSVDRDDVILPETILERIERQTIVFSEHIDALRSARRSLKRGLLLFGSPGTGKTLTIMYLIGRMQGRTAILTTGEGMGMLRSIAQLARTLAPAIVVVEDVDLIAQDRAQPRMQTGPLLFELLNEMDGLANDCDVIFVLTTNRADVLEPALASRPGRIDLAVELPMPDASARERLFALYGEGLDLTSVDLHRFAERTTGASPAYIKEVLRKATVSALADGHGTHLSESDLTQAIQELSKDGRVSQRILGFQPHPASDPKDSTTPGFGGERGSAP